MSQTNQVVQARWREDCSATVYGRLMARDGSGTAIVGQGKCLKRADISSIMFKVYEETSSGTDDLINSGTVNLTTSVFDTLQTSDNDPVWTSKQGFNFRHDLGPENFPLGDRIYTVEYTITTISGYVGKAVYRGPAAGIRGS